ncbi:hypothetical protein PVAP13_8NG050600 [Panicum virgatum]|uniref:Uncharacterized protein n=1 Tax=Panicum virgatum TaxID=38727 RepID=A0A8T0P5D9_PANVG|nr:hypothetical protein PVAP13_8NG050600 [Panicum virgatum]
MLSLWLCRRRYCSSPSFAASAARLSPHRSSRFPPPPPPLLTASTCRGGSGPGFPSSVPPYRLLSTCCRCVPPPPRLPHPHRLDHHEASRSGPSPWSPDQGASVAIERENAEVCCCGPRVVVERCQRARL